MEDAKIQITGLSQMSRALKKVNADAPKGLRLALNGIADFFIGKVTPLIPRRTGAAAKSLKARSTRTSARIAAGGNKARYYPWLDFGGRVGKNRSVERPFYSEGRYIDPTLRRERPEIEKRLGAALVAVVEGAGLDVD